MILAGLLIAIAIVVSFTITPSRRPAPAVAYTKIWLVGARSIRQMRQAGASQELLNLAFDNKHTYVYENTTVDNAIHSSHNIPTSTFASYQAIRQAFASGILPGKFKAVIYDNERWPYTPVTEQRNPTYYEALVGRLLHEHGLIYIATPAPDLMWSVGRPKDSYADYLRAGVAAHAARYADILDIQAQVREANLSKYSSFVSAAVTQARRANPRIKVIIGIRTNPGSAALAAAYQAVSHIGDGFWLNVNGLPNPAVDLLRHVYNQR